MLTQRTLTAVAAATLLVACCAGAWALKPVLPPGVPQGSPPPQMQGTTPQFMPDGQTQAAQPAPLPPEKPVCIAETTTFTAKKTFVVALTNSCEQRMRCTVNAYVVNSRGPASGRATLTLAPGSKGAASRKAYVMKLKENYGSANVSRSCRMV